jgi:6-phosphogluconate dehydrogenase
MHIGYIGLGKMGLNMVERLLGHTHAVTAYDVSDDARKKAENIGAETSSSLKALIEKLETPRTIWIMVPHTVVGAVLDELEPLLTKGDTIIEGGNSPFKDSIQRAERYESQGISFLDAGVSGGPGGAKEGACIMVGGKKDVFEKYTSLFKDLAVEDGYAYMGTHGTGHFVKMVHNGIEYGMMQALAEGFDIMKQAHFDTPLPLADIAKLYNHGSVIESRLVGWLQSGYEKHGEELEDITGSARASGEGLWTVETAKEMGIPTPVITDALAVRSESQKKPSYQGQVISVLRNQFGGHDAKK